MLLRALTLIVLAGVAPWSQAASCEATVDGTDMMTYSVQALEASRSCQTFTLHLTHSGNMPKSVMEHNWVLAKASDAEAIDADGGRAGFEEDYLKPKDPRVIAHTRLIGGGESDSVTFSLAGLKSDEAYEFFCSFPGHLTLMKGIFTVI
ncbi:MULTISPECIES: azurin [unclassified Pseudomonas]|uniref:azurin n=1 Tax=unclassified Pseudomonas TaxID=196821 RepID=UPI00131BFD67|nr:MULTISPECIES: azurin [unclassified Pseudomonas]